MLRDPNEGIIKHRGEILNLLKFIYETMSEYNNTSRLFAKEVKDILSNLDEAHELLNKDLNTVDKYRNNMRSWFV